MFVYIAMLKYSTAEKGLLKKNLSILVLVDSPIFQRYIPNPSGIVLWAVSCILLNSHTAYMCAKDGAIESEIIPRGTRAL